MEHISSIIHKILKNSGKEHLYYEGLIRINWSNFVGDIIASNSIPDRVQNNILYIKCVNSAWKQEIFFFKDKIKTRINTFLDKELLQDIKVFM